MLLATPGRALKGEQALRGTTATVAPSAMNVLDLLKATVICGLIAFVIYTFPVVGQVLLIGLLSLLWLSYAHRTLMNLFRR